jgi:transposase
VLDVGKIAALQARGVGLRKIAAELGVGVGTIYEAKKRSASLLGGSKIRERDF